MYRYMYVYIYIYNIMYIISPLNNQPPNQTNLRGEKLLVKPTVGRPPMMPGEGLTCRAEPTPRAVTDA